MDPLRLLALTETLAALALWARCHFSETLRKRWGWLGLLALAFAVRSTYLLYLRQVRGWRIVGCSIVPGDDCWWYSQHQALTLWPIIALCVAATVEIVVNMARQYGKHNRRFLHTFSAIIAAVMIGLAMLSATWIEFRAVPWPPTHVEVAYAVERILLLGCSLTLLIACCLVHFRPLPDLCGNIRIVPALFGAFLAVRAYAKFSIATAWRSYDLPGLTFALRNGEVILDASGLVLFALMACALRGHTEYDWIPRPLPRELQRSERLLDATLMRLERAARDRLRGYRPR